MRAALPILLLLIASGCVTRPLPVPVQTAQLPALPAPLADGLPAPDGALLKQGGQPAITLPLMLAGRLQPEEVRARFPATQALLGFDALGEGTFYSVTGTPPRAGVAYAPAAEPPALLGSLLAPPQPARLPLWLAHPAVEGYCYVNDLLMLIEGFDIFLTSEELTSQLALSGALGGGSGMSAMLRDFYEVAFEEDLSAWWTGELLLCWVRTPQEGLLPVYIFGVHQPAIARDKVRQMLAMYYFYVRGDRGVFTPSSLSDGTSYWRLMQYGGTPAQLDLAFAQDERTVIAGTTSAVQALLQRPGDPSAAHFFEDAALLKQHPLAVAIGFTGSMEARDTLSRFFERGVGLMPGGGREMAERMGGFFANADRQQVYVALEPGRFQWWIQGPAAADPQVLSGGWTLFQVGFISAVAQLKGWERTGGVMAGGIGETDQPRQSTPTRRRHRKPFWRQR